MCTSFTSRLEIESSRIERILSLKKFLLAFDLFQTGTYHEQNSTPSTFLLKQPTK